MRAAPRGRRVRRLADRVLETALADHHLLGDLDLVAAGAEVGAARAVLAELAVQDEGPRPGPPRGSGARSRPPPCSAAPRRRSSPPRDALGAREAVLDGGQRARRPAEKDGLGVLREGHHRGLGAEGRASDIGGEDRLVAEVYRRRRPRCHRARLRRSEGARVPGDLQERCSTRPVRTGSRCADAAFSSSTAARPLGFA